jgi:hypothetical protein
VPVARVPVARAPVARVPAARAHRELPDDNANHFGPCYEGCGCMKRYRGGGKKLITDYNCEPLDERLIKKTSAHKEYVIKKDNINIAIDENKLEHYDNLTVQISHFFYNNANEQIQHISSRFIELINLLTQTSVFAQKELNNALNNNENCNSCLETLLETSQQCNKFNTEIAELISSLNTMFIAKIGSGTVVLALLDYAFGNYVREVETFLTDLSRLYGIISEMSTTKSAKQKTETSYNIWFCTPSSPSSLFLCLLSQSVNNNNINNNNKILSSSIKQNAPLYQIDETFKYYFYYAITGHNRSLSPIYSDWNLCNWVEIFGLINNKESEILISEKEEKYKIINNIPVFGLKYEISTNAPDKLSQKYNTGEFEILTKKFTEIEFKSNIQNYLNNPPILEFNKTSGGKKTRKTKRINKKITNKHKKINKTKISKTKKNKK